MDNASEVTRHATRALQDVANDLIHMGAISAQWSAQLRNYVAIGPDVPPGELWKLSQSISKSAIDIMNFCHRTRCKVMRIREEVHLARQKVHGLNVSKSVAGALALVWNGVDDYLDTLEKALDVVEQDFASQQETILEIALNHDAPGWATTLADSAISQAKNI